MSILNPFGGPPAPSPADSAPAVNGNLPHPSVMAGAIDSNPDRGYMGRRLNPALGTSVASCGEAFGDERKQPSMASELAPLGPQDSISTAAAPSGASLFSSVRVRDANSFMRR